MTNTKHDTVLRYIDLLEEKLVETAKQALADCKPVTKVQTGSIGTEGMNFVRRYVLEDGTYAGDNYGHFERFPIACHESEPDRVLQLVKICRDGEKDILLGNFQMHPHRTGGGVKPVVSADIVGAMRFRVERDMDAHFLYFTGGSGNVNGHSMVPEENITPDHTAHGEAMARYAAQVQFRDVAFGPVKAARKDLLLEINHADDGRVADAKVLNDLFMSGAKRVQWLPVAQSLGFNSPYHAMCVITRAGLGSHMEMPIWAMGFGDVGFVFAPYEMFDTNGMEIKEGSPFKTTVVATCTNGSFGYFPSALGFQNGGYSSDSCRFTPGVGEKVAQEFVTLLKTL